MRFGASQTKIWNVILKIMKDELKFGSENVSYWCEICMDIGEHLFWHHFMWQNLAASQHLTPQTDSNEVGEEGLNNSIYSTFSLKSKFVLLWSDPILHNTLSVNIPHYFLSLHKSQPNFCVYSCFYESNNDRGLELSMGIVAMLVNLYWQWQHSRTKKKS
jgi:hypothetical protein